MTTRTRRARAAATVAALALAASLTTATAEAAPAPTIDRNIGVDISWPECPPDVGIPGRMATNASLPPRIHQKFNAP